MKEEDSLAKAPQRSGAEFVGSGCALLDAVGETRSQHSGVMSAFGRIAVKEGGFDATVGAILRKLFDLRWRAGTLLTCPRLASVRAADPTIPMYLHVLEPHRCKAMRLAVEVEGSAAPAPHAATAGSRSKSTVTKSIAESHARSAPATVAPSTRRDRRIPAASSSADGWLEAVLCRNGCGPTRRT